MKNLDIHQGEQKTIFHVCTKVWPAHMELEASTSCDTVTNMVRLYFKMKPHVVLIVFYILHNGY